MPGSLRLLNTMCSSGSLSHKGYVRIVKGAEKAGMEIGNDF